MPVSGCAVWMMWRRCSRFSRRGGGSCTGFAGRIGPISGLAGRRGRCRRWINPIGQGDGVRVVFHLAKTYRSGMETYVRPIAKPVPGTVRVGLAGLAQVEGVQFEVDAVTGAVHFAAPPDVGVAVTAGFEFDVPVRFDTDRIQTSVASFKAGDVPSVPVVELRL